MGRSENEGRQRRLNLVKTAWDEYHPDYLGFALKERPDYYEFFRNGGAALDEWMVDLIGDVKGKKLLDICCAADATQAFSWENLGASVVACDISDVAIELAEKNGKKIGSNTEFRVADAQVLEGIADDTFDVVFASYICWFEDLFQATRSWYRVLKSGGNLLLTHGHPVTQCLKEADSGFEVVWNYFDLSPEYYDFDGTPMARKHGGWGKSVPIVEFFHPVWEVVNAVAEAGFVIRKMVEMPEEGSDSTENARLPSMLGLLAHRPL